MRRSFSKIPLPLMFAFVMSVGAIMHIVMKVNVLTIPVSWDPRHSTYNGTHVYQTSSVVGGHYKTLILGFGTAYFQDPVDVYYLRKVFYGGTDNDLGRYLPIILIVEHGSLPVNTYITWTDPHTGQARKLYLVGGANRGYVIGNYHYYSAFSVASIPVYYRVEGSVVYFYPMARAELNIGEACDVIRNSGFSGYWYDVYPVLDNVLYDCRYYAWMGAYAGWDPVAVSATSASLYPSPTYYTVTVNVGDSRVTIFLSYWYAINKDPGFFVVKVG